MLERRHKVAIAAVVTTVFYLCYSQRKRYRLWFLQMLAWYYSAPAGSFKVGEKGKHAVISFTLNGKEHQLRIPYSRRLNSRQNKVFINRNCVEEEITQPSGIPYLVSPADLGGHNFVVIDS